MRDSIKLIKNAEGSYISYFKGGVDDEGNPVDEGMGYVTLYQYGDKFTDDDALVEDSRTYNQRGVVKTLNMMVESVLGGRYKLTGNIVKQEFIESEIPETYLKRMMRTVPGTGYKELNDDAMERCLKRAGKDGPVLSRGGERIFSFYKWDRDGDLEDIIVKHDNTDEVKEYQAYRRLERKKDLDTEGASLADLDKTEN